MEDNKSLELNILDVLGPHFSVDAGKLESNDAEEYARTGEQFSRNYKTIGTFLTLSEALVVYKECRGYHFNELRFHDGDGNVYDLEVTLLPKE